MAVTTFYSNVINGVLDSSAITITMIAHTNGVALYGPVILSTGTITDLPLCDSTTTAGDVNAFGICVKLPRSGTITADVSDVEICIHGIAKIKLTDATVSLNDPIQCSATAGSGRVTPALTLRSDTLANHTADAVTALKNVRASFATALSTVSSGAGSIVACFVNVPTAPGTVA